MFVEQSTIQNRPTFRLVLYPVMLISAPRQQQAIEVDKWWQVRRRELVLEVRMVWCYRDYCGISTDGQPRNVFHLCVDEIGDRR